MGKNLPRGRTKAASNAVAPHSAPQLFGNGQPEPRAFPDFWVFPAQHQERRSIYAFSIAQSQKIRTFAQNRQAQRRLICAATAQIWLIFGLAQADSFLRPLARRDARILRPALVALRARNP